MGNLGTVPAQAGRARRVPGRSMTPRGKSARDRSEKLAASLCSSFQHRSAQEKEHTRMLQWHSFAAKVLRALKQLELNQQREVRRKWSRSCNCTFKLN
jgi:hypothetical protein